MTLPDLLRPSRDGDQFHYTWAARQSLRLLDEHSGLHALFVEAVDRSELPSASVGDDGDDDVLATDVENAGAEDDTLEEGGTGTGDEVIDLAEYWGSSDIDSADRVIYRQFKHSTRHANEPWTLSFLTKTLIGFARKYRSLKDEHPQVLGGVQFEFITNRPAAQSVLDALADLRAGAESAPTRSVRERLGRALDDGDVAALCQRLVIDERAPSLLKLRRLLELDVADLLPGAPSDQALLLREMISVRATSISGDNPAVRRADVLAALKTSDDQLLPAPNLIETPRRPISRRQFAEIAAQIQGGEGLPVLVHGPGGVGKSVLADSLKRYMPAGSVTIVYDCYGNGTYRRPSAPRHRAKQGLVQLVNELAALALCDPIIPSATADDSDYARTFLHRLSVAAQSIAITSPGALLTVVIDAADNAAMVAQEMGERSFIHGLAREQVPANVRLVATCRTERIGLLGMPANHRDIPLSGFDEDETGAHLHLAYPAASPADVAEFHVRTGRNPRVQATVLDATSDLREALAWLAPDPTTAADTLAALIERQVAEVRDSRHGLATEIDQICVGLSALRPMIPVRVLAELAGVQESVVVSFVSDLGRPLLVDGMSVQFRDEPTETWFRTRFRPTGEALQDFLARVKPLADREAYVAVSLPALLFEAGRIDDLFELALSEDSLPDNALPAAERNEVQRREIAEQRTHFALTAALRSDRDFQAAQLALRLGALTAGRTRRIDLLRRNTDLASRFLDPSVIEHLVATRSLTSDWPSSNLPVEGALLSTTAGQTEQARNRLRSAMSWIHAWVRRTRSAHEPSGIGGLDIQHVAWGLLNTDGAATCVRYLRSWRPRTLAFDVGVEIARRLLDAGRLADFDELARASRGRHLKLAVAQACAERDPAIDPEVVAHLISPLIGRAARVAPSQHDDYHNAKRGDPVENGLTAITWLITRAYGYGLLAANESAIILQKYLPADLGFRTGGWHDRGVWHPILGFALLARLDGRRLDPEEIQGPQIREARAREKFESSRSLREFDENVVPLVAWAEAWLDLELEPSAQATTNFARRANALLRASPPERPTERHDSTMVNSALRVVARALARHPGLVDDADLLEFEHRFRSTITGRTLINVIRQTAGNPRLYGVSSQLAARCHDRLTSAHEDAGELATDHVLLARATYRTSPDEAKIHFQSAIDITDAIGDDAWARWSTLLNIARSAGHGASDQPGRAYRLGQIAESVEPYLGEMHHEDVLSAAAHLSLCEALAIGSRWRDRRVAPLSDVVDAITAAPDMLLSRDPNAALLLLPLGTRLPDDSALATALGNDPANAIGTLITYLQFRRTAPPKSDDLNTLLSISDAAREAIEDRDPSLLWFSQDPTMSELSDPRAFPSVVLDDLDFGTAAGWTEGIRRGREVGNRDAVVSHVVTLGITPTILHALEACPEVAYWDVSRLMAALQGVSLSMGARAALDSTLANLIARFASDFMLNPWRQVDLEQAHALTGTGTPYERIASRALADRLTFSAEQAYALAAILGRRLDIEERLNLFDTAASLFDDVTPIDAHDGARPVGTTGGWDPATAMAAAIWTALGDPAGETRWRAAHSVYLALTLGHTAVAARLRDFAIEAISPAPFLDARLEFYARHAHQWLLFGLSRASVEPTAHATAAFFAPLLEASVATTHAANVPLARDTLLRLHATGAIQLSAAARAEVKRAGQPIGMVRREWGAELERLNSLSELAHQDAGIGSAGSRPPTEPATAVSSIAPDPGAMEEPTREDQFRFFFDFRQYWCDPLGNSFGIEARSIERLVEEVLVDRWAIPSRGRAQEDIRRELDLYPRDNYPYKGEWPKEDDLDFYLSVHALCEVAGVLLQHRPTVQQYDEDVASGESEYTRFASRYLPSRDDGRWLSDRRDRAPASAFIAHDDSSSTGSQPAPWMTLIAATRFREEALPSPEIVRVWGHRSVQHYSRNERVTVTSALVTPGSAHSLLRALETAPDKRAYRIPDANDHEFSSTIPGFELTGWIQSHGYSGGCDRQDPSARGIQFPPARPSHGLPGVGALLPDVDYRLWRDGTAHAVIVSTAWDEYTDERQTVGTDGYALDVDRAWLTTLLGALDRWLVIEVQIRRHEERRHAVATMSDDLDESQASVSPRDTRYFLFDHTGEIHES